jgi:sulfur carrier protein
MRVNGQEVVLGEPCTLLTFLEREGYVLTRLAVEKNGKIVPKAAYESELLSEGDRLEIVSFVGGG